MDDAARLIRLLEPVCKFYDTFYASDGVGSEATMRESQVSTFGQDRRRAR